MQEKVEKQLKKIPQVGNKGITLIALVVTIVVLLILAGVSIVVLWGEHGILKTAQDATGKFEIEAEREKIDNVRIDWGTKKVIDKNVTAEDFFDMLEASNIIEDSEKDRTGLTENNTYIVETKSGYAVKIIVDENGNVQIGDIEKVDLEPKIRDIKITTTENSITAKAIVSGTSGKTIKYEYKLENEPESEYQEMQPLKNGSYTVTGLTKGASYIIKVTITHTAPLVEDTRTAIAQEQESDWAYLGRVAKSIATRTDINIDSNTQNVKGKTELGENYNISVGDTFKVRYKGEDEPGIRNVRIIGFKHDDLVEQTVYGGINEKAGITFDFVDFLIGVNGKRMHTNNTNDYGWVWTEVRRSLNGYTTRDPKQTGSAGGYAALLSNSSLIKQVKKEYMPKYNSEILSESPAEDYLWLLSCGEIWSDGYNGGNTRGDARNSEGSQYAYYKKVTDGIAWNSANTELVKKVKSWDSSATWWLRSPAYHENLKKL